MTSIPSTLPAQAEILWCSENLLVADVSESDAPSPGAWGLLQWARTGGEAQHVFWSLMFARLIPLPSTDGIRGDPSDMMTDEEIQETIHQLRTECAQDLGLPPPKRWNGAVSGMGSSGPRALLGR